LSVSETNYDGKEQPKRSLEQVKKEALMAIAECDELMLFTKKGGNLIVEVKVRDRVGFLEALTEASNRMMAPLLQKPQQIINDLLSPGKNN
jgi:hypothetical protein